jgi:hypothetical protein
VGPSNKKKRRLHEKEVEKSQKAKEAAKRKNPVVDHSDGNVLFLFD